MTAISEQKAASHLHPWERMEQIVSKVRYKEGYAFSVRAERHDEVAVEIVAPSFENVDCEGGTVRITWTLSIPISELDGKPDYVFHNFVFDAIRGLEVHEAREWFTVNNVRVFDPHKSDIITHYRPKEK